MRNVEKYFKKCHEKFLWQQNKAADPDMNPALRLAIEKAKSVNVPNDVVKRALIKQPEQVPMKTTRKSFMKDTDRAALLFLFFA